MQKTIYICDICGKNTDNLFATTTLNHMSSFDCCSAKCLFDSFGKVSTNQHCLETENIITMDGITMHNLSTLKEYTNRHTQGDDMKAKLDVRQEGNIGREGYRFVVPACYDEQMWREESGLIQEKERRNLANWHPIK